MWAAAITSVVGAAYTSVSFIRSFHPKIEKYHNWVINTLIIVSIVTIVTFALIGKPGNVLIAGLLCNWDILNELKEVRIYVKAFSLMSEQMRMIDLEHYVERYVNEGEFN